VILCDGNDSCKEEEARAIRAAVGIESDRIGGVGAKLLDLRRTQHATRCRGGNEDVSVSVHVSSALRLASDSSVGDLRIQEINASQLGSSEFISNL